MIDTASLASPFYSSKLSDLLHPHNMSSPSLEALPNEVLLIIIQQVNLSKANFTALNLISHRFHELIIGRGNRLLYDIAALQFPLALITERDPPAFSIQSYDSLSLQTLEKMAIRSEACENALRIFQKIERRTEEEARHLRKHFELPSWEENVLVGLHIFYKMQKTVNEVDPYHLQTVGPSCTRGLLHYEAYVLSLPPALCLAMRHTTFIGLDSIQASAWMLGNRLLRGSMFEDLYSDLGWMLAVEQHPVSALFMCARSVEIETSQRQKEGRPPTSLHWQSIRDDIRQLQDKTAARLPVWADHIDPVTRRIRQDILENWNRFIEKNPRVIAGLRSQEVRSTEDVRALVEGFLVGFED